MGKTLIPSKFDNSYRMPVFFSLALHLAVVVAMLFGWESTPDITPVSAPRHINAVVIDASELPSSKRKIEEKRKQDEEVARKKRDTELKAKRLEEKEKEAKALQKKEKEEAKKKEIQKQEEAKKQQLENEKKLKLKKELEEKIQQDELAKKREKEKAENLKKEQLAKEKQNREADRQQKEKEAKKAEQEKQLLEAMKNAEQDRLVRETEREDVRLRDEQQRQQMLSAQQQADASERDRFMGLIKGRIEQKWHKPPSADSGIQVTIRLSLVPTGELVKAEIISKSGNDAFDRSALSAVYAVGKFPVPDSPRVFEDNFRRFNLSFNPKD